MNKEKSSISGKDCGINWNEHLQNKDNLKHLFASIGLDGYEFKNIKKHYSIDNHRYGVIVEVKEKDSGHLKEIIIDVISGEPTWSQLMDCTFNLGADCDKRIIIYYDGPNSKDVDDHHCDRFLGISFAKHNNYYKIDTYVVKGSILTDETAAESIKYHIEISPDSYNVFNEDHEIPPLKDDMEKVLLWLYYDELYWGLTDTISSFEDWIWKFETKSLGVMDYYIDWNEDGAFIKLTVPFYKMGEFKWLLTYHYQEIHRLLRDSEVTVNKISKVTLNKKLLDYYEIIITIIDQPFSNFIDATPEIKSCYVERILDKEEDLSDFYNDAIEEMYLEDAIEEMDREEEAVHLLVKDK